MKTIRSFWARLCAWAIGALGMGAALSSCEKINDVIGGGENYVMYGTPTMDYVVKGQVVDSKTGKPVEGIQVGRPWNYDDVPAITDKDGKFSISGNEFPHDTLHVKFTDIDGEANGAYSDSKETVNLKQTEKGDKSWYSGKFEAKDVKVKINKK